MADSEVTMLSNAAAAMAHALNNVTATLYGALDSLEASPVPGHNARLSRALTAACGKTQALSAASLLLSVSSPSGQSQTACSATNLLIDAHALEALYEALHETADVRGAAVKEAPVCLDGIVDLARIKALWICVAFMLRRSCGASAELRAGIGLETGAEPTTVALRLTANTRLPPRSEWLDIKHPCGLALAQVFSSDWSRALKLSQSNTELVIHCPGQRAGMIKPPGLS